MAITVYEASRKRERTPKILSIYNSATPFMDVSGTFRDNIRLFLRNYSEKEDYSLHGNPVWCTLLANEANGVVFPLYTVEEHIPSSSNPLCDFCRCFGWGHHYVSKRRYHLIVPRKDEWRKPLTKESLKSTSHLLHGVIHCNGFGHLLCINGDASSSSCLSGDNIMDFWDRLCATLQTRKISLDDISRKRSMELRLLHGVAYGRPWFGKWGYRFSHGSFGVTEDQYRRAIQLLSSLELDKIMEDFSETKSGRMIQMILGIYREASDTTLATLSDLLQFMLAFGSKAPVERSTAMALVGIAFNSLSTPNSRDQNNGITCSCSLSQESDRENSSGSDSAMEVRPPKSDIFTSLALKLCSRWSGKRLKEAAVVVHNVLEERKRCISRQELRDAVRLHIGDTGLIDFLLKHIDKVHIGNKVVHRCTNPNTRMLEFSLRSSPGAAEEPRKRRKLPITNDRTSSAPGRDVYKDVSFLYENLLLDYPDSDILGQASEVVMNCKSFAKEFHLLPSSDHHNNRLTVQCQVIPNHDELLADFTRPLPQGELVVLPQNSTVRELKSETEKALRDTYCVMETFEVLEIRNRELEKIDEGEVVGSETEVVMVRGFGLDRCTELRYEGGFDDWTVECRCGARDDDGERMVACDSCRVWHHTLCNSIEDDEAVPSVFLCSKCSQGSLRSKKRRALT
ncbi:PREDICTED: PHD finger protein At2g01810 [Tarenaya hassleriana]|uniref:PHD finger protein At2g01810 n=1 Tax=Tarenaya hassleriana TaxID=28532 RepID=UPI00053CA07F|nr:PREDICTED: PHD finger protein At2g01810 [Tarenaya hassleriana]